ncbi:MAG: acetate--CoA ligase [Candidatus Diapherotrites archaeon]|nr:acetate--CoA ligase [Candidatus Diapherotrites archaeon]
MHEVEKIEKPLEQLRLKPNLENYDEARKNWDWEEIKKQFTWYKTGKVNMAYEAIDRHAETWRKNKVALYYVSDKRQEKYTYQDLKYLSNKFANVLKKHGIGKGERVGVFMPRSPEMYIALLGMLKAGVIPVPLFEAFMEEAVKDRMKDCDAVGIITVPSMRDRIAYKDLPALKHTIMVGDSAEIHDNEINYYEEMKEASDKFDIVWLDLEDPLLIHYTSGSTGKPKGVLHAQRAMIGHYATAKYVLDLHDEDIYWCTADPGWVTGTSYGIFGPWLNGASEVIRGGRFSVESWYQTIQDYKVTIWYSAPTAFRMFMAAGAGVAEKYDISSLRLIYSVGEPLNPEVVRWAMDVWKLPIHDTWWMTETGMQLVCNYPCMPIKPGSMGKPFPGLEGAIVDDNGNRLPPLQIGNLAIKKGWPSMMKTIWKNEEKYKSYFVKGSDGTEWYVSGDSAYTDEEGYFWFQGRLDDIIKTSGERVGPFEVESKLVEHPAVAEAGVIGKPDALRGNIIKAFIVLRPGYQPSEELKKEIMEFVKTKLAAHAKPREIEFIDKLPKTRSGKIMRRVLKAKELGLPVGDLSTMED